MPDIPCGKCGSGNIRKNGFTEAGALKYHCKAGLPSHRKKNRIKRRAYRKTSV